jgi:DNA-binding Lrp family transcriptional regulator
MPVAFICLTTEPDFMVDVLKLLKKIKGVEEAYMVYGVYDIIAKVRSDNMSLLKDLITIKIHKIEKIQNAITIMVEDNS